MLIPRSSGRALRAAVALVAFLLPLAAHAQTGLRFNGSSQYVTFGQAASLGTSTFTLELWFKREGPGASTTTGTGGVIAIPLMAKGRAEADGSTRDMNYILGIRSDSVLVVDFEEGTGQASPGLNHPIAGVTKIRNDIWYHAAATFNGTRLALYLNGNLEKDTTLAAGRLPQSASIQHASLATGITSASASPPTTAAGFFQGVIDEPHIWNHARTEQNIRDSLGLQITSAPGLIGRWGLNEGTGNTAANSGSGASANGTLQPAGTLPAWVSGSLFVLPNSAALDLGPSTGHVVIGNVPALGLGHFTLECWFRRDGTGITASTGTGGVSAVPLITKGTGEADLQDNRDMNYFFGIGAGNVLVGDFEEGAGAASQGLNHPVSGITPVVTGTWYHGAATYDGNRWRLYLNGSLEAELFVGQPPCSTSIQLSGLGTAIESDSSAEGFFDGALEEVRIWNHARTAAEIVADMNTQISTARSGLIARWGLNEGGGSTVRGSAGTTINGTIKGATNWNWVDSGPFNAVPPSPPSAPAGLTASAETFASIRLQWTDVPTNETRFEIQRGPGGGPYDSIGVAPANATSYIDAGLPEQSSFCYRVRAVNGVGPSNFTPEACAFTSAEGSAALDLSGANTFVSFGDAGPLKLETFTLECWFRRDGTGTAGSTGAGGINAIPILTKGTGEVDQEDNRDANYFLGIDAATGVLVADFEEGALGASPGLNHPVRGANAVTSGVWHHAAATYDTLKWRLYLDGNLERELLVDQPVRATSIQHAALGSGLKSNGDSLGFFDGAIDEARVWNYARTPSEILGSINAEIRTLQAGLVARWGLNEAAGSVVNGVAGSGVSGTIRGTGFQWTANAPFNIPAPTEPLAPDGLGALPINDAQIQLQWIDRSNNELAFEIERSITGVAGPYAPLDTVSANTFSFTDTGLDPLAEYCYQVRATNTVGSSVYTNTACATTFDETNTALDLGNARAFVTFGDPVVLDLPRFTIETWFRRDGAGVPASTGSGGIDAVPLVTKGTAEADDSDLDMNFLLGIASSGVLAGDFEEGALGTTPGQNHPVLGLTQIVNGQWYHAALTYDGTALTIYLNGSLEAEVDIGEPTRFNSILPAALGTGIQSDGDSIGAFDGAIDEARIWNYARSEAEIQALVNTPARHSEFGLVARWGLNEGTGSIVRGSAGTTVDGTIHGIGSSWITGAPFNAVIVHPPALPVLVGPLDQVGGEPTSLSLAVEVSDPDADALSVTFYGRALDAAAGPDFTLIGLPDTQYYTSNANGATPAMFDQQTQWIADNRAALNIVDMIQLGDCTDHGDSFEVEWQRADHSLSIIENPATTGLEHGIPYGVCVGNHDQSPGGDAAGTTNFYNQYFGSARFAGRAYYGGHYGSNNDNHYQLFSASGMDFILISMEYDTAPDAPVLAWADGLLTTHANRRAIVASHYLINNGNPGSFGSQGQAIYNALRGHANLFMMLCGHITAGEGRRTDVFGGNTVHTVLSDYQSRGPDGLTSHGGDGWLRIYQFSPANNVIRVRTYSTLLNQFMADADSSSQFTLPYDMGGTSPFVPIATVNAASGTTASAGWNGLSGATAYEWYASVSDGHRTVTGPVWHFTTVDLEPPTAHLVAPNGGQAWASSSHQTIQWTAEDNLAVTAVDLDYSIDGGATYPHSIASGLTGVTQHDWLVPDAVGNDVRVRVTAHDAAGNSATDASDASFRITDGEKPALALVAPNGGESWLTGSVHAITWTASDNVAVTSVDLAYSSNGGASFPTALATGIANSGSFDWTLPAALTATGRVLITARDAAGNVARDTSGTNFAITDGTPPQITVTLPNGGEVFVIGLARTITWTATDNVGVTNVDLEYSTDGGATFLDVAAGVATSGSHSWTVPNAATTQARVRVKAYDAAGYFSSDVSNANFSIAVDGVPPTAQLTSPNGGEAWVTSSHHDIVWTASDNQGVASIDLEYTTDNGGTWTVIVAGLPGTNTQYDWTVPDAVTTNARVRVTARDGANNTATDGSNAVFRITDGERPTVAVTAPNGAETWTAGSVRAITWTAADNVGVTAVDLAFSSNGGATFATVVATGIANSGSFNWTVPSLPTTNGRFRAIVRDAVGNTARDSSDANFTITDVTPPQLALTIPNGGETFVIGQAQSITWTATDNVGVTGVDLQYSTDGGATWLPIAFNLPNTGAYSWTVPNTPTTQARVWIKVRDAGENTSTVTSAANFTITQEINLVGNPGFESNLNGWTAYGSATLTRLNAGGRNGPGVLQIRGSSSSSNGCDDLPNWVSTVARLGAVYRIQAYVKSTTGARGKVKIRLYEMNGSSQIGSTAYSNEISFTTGWQLLTLDYTVRRAGTTLNLRITNSPSASGEVFLVDDVLIKLLGPGGGTPPDAAPVVTAPATLSGSAGIPLSFTVGASDADGPAITTLNMSGAPGGATFATNAAKTQGTFSWTPVAADVRAAPYVVTFTAANTKSGNAVASITVGTAPANLAGNSNFDSGTHGWGAYSGATLTTVATDRGNSLQIRGSSSSSFGCDDEPTNWVATVAGLGAVYRIQAYVKSATGARGKVKIRVYELNGSSQVGSTAYSNEPVLSASWRLLTMDYTVRRAGTTLSMRITDEPSASGETFLVDDVGISLVQLPTLLAGDLTLEPSAPAGLVPTEPALVFGARFAPNPALRHGVLQFATTRSGAARVEVFDSNGRRVAMPLDERDLPAGRHELGIGHGRGTALASGIYFYRVRAAEGVLQGRFAIIE